jgi:hypothetical protein
VNTRLFLSLLALSLLLSTPSLLRLPRVLPFFDPEVRSAAPRALEELRAQGLWLVNVDIRKITQEENKICFQWEHQYTRRGSRSAPELLTTCIDAAH